MCNCSFVNSTLLPSTSKKYCDGLEHILVSVPNSGICSSSKPTPNFFVLHLAGSQTEHIGCSLHLYLSYPFLFNDFINDCTSELLRGGSITFWLSDTSMSSQLSGLDFFLYTPTLNNALFLEPSPKPSLANLFKQGGPCSNVSLLGTDV